MDLNLIDIDLASIKALEDKLFQEDAALKELISLKGVECYCEFEEVE